MNKDFSPESVLMNNRNTQIGNICIQWSHLEYLAALGIWSMLHLDDKTGMILTGGLDLLPRLNMGHSLAVHLNAPKTARNTFKITRSAIQDQDIINRRNLIIHGHRLDIPGRLDAETFESHRGKGAGIKKQLPVPTSANLVKRLQIFTRSFSQNSWNLVFYIPHALNLYASKKQKPIQVVLEENHNPHNNRHRHQSPPQSSPE